MANCRNCGNEMSGNAVKCPYCGEVHIGHYGPQDDNGGILYVFVGLCLPIIGLILFFAWNKKKPKSARNAMIGALISLPIIMIMGIVSAFAIPAVNAIIDQTNSDVRKNAVYADALSVERATELLCADSLCEDGTEFTWGDISVYLEGIDVEYYDLTSDTTVSYLLSDGVHVRLEAAGTGELEFIPWMIPSETTRDDSVIIDIN